MRTRRYTIHPAAKLMPPMAPEEFAALKADIKRHGLREPIVLYKGKVLDGIHRMHACLELKIPLRTKELDDEVKDPVEYVISLNLRRRQLNAGQRAMIALKLLPVLERQAKERQRAGGRTKGSAALRQAGKAAAHAAARADVSTRYIEQAKRLQDRAPDLAKEVEVGTRTLADATHALDTTDKHKKQELDRLAFNKRAAAEQRKLERKHGAEHVAPNAGIRAVLEAQGDTAEGRRRGFEQATIRQIKLAYMWVEHRKVVGQLEAVMKETKAENFSEAVARILDAWEQGRGSR